MLPNRDLEQFYQLKTKRGKTELSPKELTHFFKLIKAEEKLRVKRIEILGALAELKEVPLAKLNKELGIQV